MTSLQARSSNIEAYMQHLINICGTEINFDTRVLETFPKFLFLYFSDPLPNKREHFLRFPGIFMLLNKIEPEVFAVFFSVVSRSNEMTDFIKKYYKDLYYEYHNIPKDKIHQHPIFSSLYTYNCASNRLEYLDGTFVSQSYRTKRKKGRLGLHLEEAGESNNSNQNGSDGYDDLFDIEINNQKIKDAASIFEN
jgi:hypothetical protein